MWMTSFKLCCPPGKFTVILLTDPAIGHVAHTFEVTGTRYQAQGALRRISELPCTSGCGSV